MKQLFVPRALLAIAFSPAARSAITAETAGVGGSLSVHVSGTNFDAFCYAVYAPRTKTWWNPSAYATGDYSTESTQQTGKTISIRDTYTFVGPATYKDISEAQIDGSWKTTANANCTKL